MCTFEITLITRTTESLLFEMISNTYYQDVNPLYNTYHSPAKNNEVKPCMGSGGGALCDAAVKGRSPQGAAVAGRIHQGADRLGKTHVANTLLGLPHHSEHKWIKQVL